MAIKSPQQNDFIIGIKKAKIISLAADWLLLKPTQIMALININGINLNINVQGKGLPLILIHGVGGDLTHLQIISESLSAHFKVIAYDCRGHGLSDKPESFTLTDHVADVLAIMDHYGIQKTYLNGISMGSYIAQGVAVNAPHRISKLILTVPKSNGLTSSVQRLLTQHKKKLSGLNAHQTILALLPYMTYDAQAMEKHINIFETNLSPLQFYAANKALAGFDFRADLPKVTAKTLVISGRYDELNPVEEGQLCALLIPDASLIVMEYSGHVPHYEETEKYLEIVEDFLTS